MILAMSPYQTSCDNVLMPKEERPMLDGLLRLVARTLKSIHALCLNGPMFHLFLFVICAALGIRSKCKQGHRHVQDSTTSLREKKVFNEISLQW
jgi:hypothetical protein